MNDTREAGRVRQRFNSCKVHIVCRFYITSTVAGVVIIVAGCAGPASSHRASDVAGPVPACYRAQPLPAPRRPSAESEQLSEEARRAVDEHVRRSFSALEAAYAGFTWCYETEMRRAGPFHETASVQLTVLATGVVQRFELSGYAPQRTDLEICMARYACSVTFPRQPLGEDVVVEQRITMTPQKAASPTSQ